MCIYFLRYLIVALAFTHWSRSSLFLDRLGKFLALRMVYFLLLSLGKFSMTKWLQMIENGQNVKIYVFFIHLRWEITV